MCAENRVHARKKAVKAIRDLVKAARALITAEQSLIEKQTKPQRTTAVNKGVSNA